MVGVCATYVCIHRMCVWFVVCMYVLLEAACHMRACVRAAHACIPLHHALPYHATHATVYAGFTEGTYTYIHKVFNR